MKCTEIGCVFNAAPGSKKCPRHEPKGVKKEKKRTTIRKVAIKRQAELDEYHNKTKAEHLKKNPECQICSVILNYKKNGGKASWWPKCGKKAVETHHVEGRENQLLNKSKLLSSCDSKKNPRNGHAWIKEHPRQAEELKLTISRIKVKNAD